MAILNTKSFAQLVQGFAAAMQARVSSVIVSFSTGSIWRAANEADAGNALWLQALIAQVLAVTRATSSNGIDLDTWCVQFMPALPNTISATLPNGTPRLQATFGTTQVTFSRNTVSTTAPFIPVGATVKTSDGSQTFAVYADATNSAYSAVLGGYTLPANVQTVNVPVRALVAGTIANVGAGAISLIASQITGIDTVTNATAVSNAVDFESDAALRARFALFIQQLSKATEAAITFAIQSIQVGLQVAIHEQADVGGALDYGMVTIYVDDGSGAISGALVTAANAAATAVRAAGVRLGVYAAATLTANYSMTIANALGFTHSAVIAAVAAAVNSFINSTGLENTLHYSQIAAIAYGVPGVTNVTGLLLNGGTADLVAAAGQTIKVGTGSVV